MGELQPLPEADGAHVPPRKEATVTPIKPASCALCGAPLSREAQRFALISPLTSVHLTVCRTCRRAAIGEGYRPAV